jgi:hypothetical protein
MDLRALIVEWVRENGCSGPWLLRLWQHLNKQGVSSEDAIDAMGQFVDEALAIRAKRGRV